MAPNTSDESFEPGGGATPGATEGPSETRASVPRPGRAWWQWVIGVGLVLAGAGMFTLRWVRDNHPEWIVSLTALDSLPFSPPEGTRVVDRVSAAPGALAGYNLLLISLDTTRADRLGYHGNRDVETPVMDRLAREGVFFSRAITTSPTTLPSHSSIMTGLYPLHHGARRNGSTALADSNVTLAEILSDNGYATAGMVSAFVLDHAFGISQGFEVYNDEVTNFIDAPTHREAERPGNETTDYALAWLRGVDAEKPFFLWVHYYDPHGPYEPPGEFAQRYAKMPYDGEIAFVDTQIDRLLRQISEMGRADRTLIVLVGDHGEGLGQHLESSHGILLMDATMHVPMLFHCPGKIAGGSMIERQVCITDILPTTLTMMGIEHPEKCDGLDLTSTPAAGRVLYGETFEGFHQYCVSPIIYARDERYKYVYGPTPQLYDVAADFREKKDVIAQEPKIAEAMQERLREFFGVDLDRALSLDGTSVQLTDEQSDKLKALGYAGGGTSSSVRPRNLLDPKAAMKLILMVDRALASVERAEDRPEAIKRMEAIAADNPDFYPVHKYLSDLYFREEQYYMAQASIERALDIYPDIPINLMVLARTQFLLGEVDQAIETYKKTITLASDKFSALAELGRLYVSRNRFTEAAPQCEAAFLLRPDDVLNLDFLIESQVKIGRRAELMRMLREALDRNPRLNNLRAELALLLADEGRYTEAIAVVEAGLEHDPQQAALRNALGRVLIDPRRGADDRIDEAVAMLEEICSRPGPANARYLHSLALGYARQGKIEAAIRKAEEALAAARAANLPRVAARVQESIRALKSASSAS